MFLLISKVLVLILCLFLTCSEGLDYCRNDLCSPGVTHIGCDVAKKFGPKCTNDASILAVNQSVQQSVLEAFNSNRKRWAMGSRPACKMATMSWDQDLAKLAELNARKCEVQDDCHNTEKYPSSGQTSFFMWQTVAQASKDPTHFLHHAVNVWSEAGQGQMTFGDLDNFTAEVHTKFGHKTLLLNENNSKVGCAISSFTKEDNNRYYQIVCNYATHNVYGTPIYTHCAVAGSGCPNGISSIHSPLCA